LELFYSLDDTNSKCRNVIIIHQPHRRFIVVQLRFIILHFFFIYIMHIKYVLNKNAANKNAPLYQLKLQKIKIRQLLAIPYCTYISIIMILLMISKSCIYAPNNQWQFPDLKIKRFSSSNMIVYYVYLFKK
jgi:hypothetical protein